MTENKSNGLRGLIIWGMTRKQQINFIKRKDKSFISTDFSAQTDEKIRQLALALDRKLQTDRNKKQKKIELRFAHLQSQKSKTDL